MEETSTNTALKVVGVVALVAVFVAIIRAINRKTEIKTISDRGLEALKDPVKLKKIEEAIENSKQSFEKTDIWENPSVDLN